MYNQKLFYKKSFQLSEALKSYKPKHLLKRLHTFAAVFCIFAITAVSVAAPIALAAGMNLCQAFADDTKQDTARQNSDSQKTVTYKFPEIGLQVNIPDDLVCFTRTVTSNNPNLKLIQADSADELRSLMQVNHLYLEAVPQENINYEILIGGKELPIGQPGNLSDLTQEELNTAFQDYVNNIVKENQKDQEDSKTTESVTDSRIYKNNDFTYFVTNVTSISENFVNVKILKYYTIVNGKYITYTLQTTNSEVTPMMQSKLESIVNTASYPDNLKKSILDNYVFREITSSILGFAGPIALLGLLLFALTRMTAKKKV